jgi:hypothetical protein
MSRDLVRKFLRAILNLSVTLVALGLLAIGTVGVWAFRPTRNAAGNPSLETLVSRCRIDDGAWTLSHYVSESGGATVAGHGSVTASSEQHPERQIHFSYGWPWVTGITCLPDGALLSWPDSRSLKLETARIQELREDPILLWNGEAKGSGRERRASHQAWFLAGAAAILTALALLAPLIWRPRRRERAPSNS